VEDIRVTFLGAFRMGVWRDILVPTVRSPLPSLLAFQGAFFLFPFNLDASCSSLFSEISRCFFSDAMRGVSFFLILVPPAGLFVEFVSDFPLAGRACLFAVIFSEFCCY